jgi:hypothetical protein
VFAYPFDEMEPTRLKILGILTACINVFRPFTVRNRRFKLADRSALCRQDLQLR